MNRSILADSDSDDERSNADVAPPVAAADIDSMELAEASQPSEELTIRDKY